MLKESDYFKGCKTILNSEIAALKVVKEIYASCGDVWTDQDFGPKNKDDIEGSKNSLYLASSPM